METEPQQDCINTSIDNTVLLSAIAYASRYPITVIFDGITNETDCFKRAFALLEYGITNKLINVYSLNKITIYVNKNMLVIKNITPLTNSTNIDLYDVITSNNISRDGITLKLLATMISQDELNTIYDLCKTRKLIVKCSKAYNLLTLTIQKRGRKYKHRKRSV